VNKFSVFSAGSSGEVLSVDKISKALKKFSKKLILLDAADSVKKETGAVISAGIYMLGYAVFNNLIPLSSDLVLEAIVKTVPEKYSELNKKVFKLPLKVQ